MFGENALELKPEAGPKSTASRGRIGILLVLILFVACALTVGLVIGREWFTPRSLIARSTQQPVGYTGEDESEAKTSGESWSGVSGEIDASRDNAIVRASRLAGPSVVSVSVIQTRLTRRGPFFSQRDDFFEQFFGDMFPPLVYRERIPGLGSGFIIDSGGYILTNEHVVRNADEIKVTLPDGRQFDAKVAGSDPNYDLAVLKVGAKGLPAAVLGNSDDLVVGEWAIAIGNPFGFLLNDPSPSVTAGVVSAIRRDVKPTGSDTGIYKEMIQTDAAINPGNSGGPLVNGKGEVIGVNTFIFTQSGGSLGMGFAIPVNVAKRVFAEVLKYGTVRGVWIGLSVQDITPYVAAQLEIRDVKGVIVVRLEDGSPAAKAGIHVGDVIRKIQGQTVTNSGAAQRALYGAAIGDLVRVTIERDGSTREVTLRLVEVPG
ncbi:MAG: trypsin-like peptidase domain-containing protein [Candidatus Eisenbacteria bacterium]